MHSITASDVLEHLKRRFHDPYYVLPSLEQLTRIADANLTLKRWQIDNFINACVYYKFYPEYLFKLLLSLDEQSTLNVYASSIRYSWAVVYSFISYHNPGITLRDVFFYVHKIKPLFIFGYLTVTDEEKGISCNYKPENTNIRCNPAELSFLYTLYTEDRDMGI